MHLDGQPDDSFCQFAGKRILSCLRAAPWFFVRSVLNA
jgi:hypothetical protein